MPSVRVQLEFDAVRVYIRDVLQVNVRRSELLGVQSWTWPGNYSIEYTLRGGTMLTEYTAEEMWLAVLDGLAKLPL